MIKFKKSVSDRVSEFGAAVDLRIKPDFERINRKYPPEKIMLIGLKEEKLLEVWIADGTNNFQKLKTYPVLKMSGVSGPKLKEGDRQVPEGFYRIEALNPNSLFHLALRLNYPNEFDCEKAKEEGRQNPGSDIMIHGSDRSVGCLAMGDEAIEEIFVLAAETGIENISVLLSPMDFRVKEIASVFSVSPSWVVELYAGIKKEMMKFR